MHLFTDNEDTWSGGFYELAVELGPPSDSRLKAALQALWQNVALDGCYLRRDLEPAYQERVEPSLALLERHGHLLGLATLPNGIRVACGCFAIREEEGSDWLDFYLPMGALATAYDVGAFPCDDGTNSRLWREPLDVWLVTLAQAVFGVAPFRLALVGHEVSGRAYAADIAVSGVPAERWEGCLWQKQDELTWYPPTRYGAGIALSR